MAVSPYSYVLNQIRLGKSQVDSYASALLRFPEYAPQRVYNQWLSAWVGKYTAQMMQANIGSTLEDYLNLRTGNASPPVVGASPQAFPLWLSTVLDSPYDMQLLAKVTVGSFEEFGTWRYQMRGTDTYAMIQRTVEGIIVKEYLRGSKGKITPMESYIIGVPRDL